MTKQEDEAVWRIVFTRTIDVGEIERCLMTSANLDSGPVLLHRVDILEPGTVVILEANERVVRALVHGFADSATVEATVDRVYIDAKRASEPLSGRGD